MKDKILKIAKVKSEKDFYKKFPTEEAFMAKHGKALKKAAMGTKMVQTQLEQLTDFGNPPIAQNGFAFGDAITNVNAMNAGITKEEQVKRDAMAQLQAKDNSSTNKYSGIMDSISGIGGQVMSAAADGGLAMRKGGKLKKAQGGFDFGGLGKAIGTATQSKGGLGNSLVDMFGGNSKDIMNVGDKGALRASSTGAAAKGFGAGAEAAGLGIINSASDILGGIGQMKEQQANIKKADQTAQISGLTAQAAESQDISKPNRKYVRPEDALVQPGQLGSPQGTGTNYLAQYGAHVGGNPTEVQNMYNPGNIYDDLGFTPLNDSNPKQFVYGGKAYKSKPMAQSSDVKSASNTFNTDDFSNYSTIINKYPNMSNDTSYMYTHNTPTGTEQFFHNTNQGKPISQLQRGNEFTNLSPEQVNAYKQKVLTGTGGFRYGGHLPTAEFGDYFQNSGQASIGKGVGSAIGSAFFGPLGGMVGGALGSVAGNVFGGADDANKLANFQTQTKENTERSAWAAGAKSLHNANSSFMEDGGWMNPEYNPQVIAKFGDLTAQDFYNASKEMRSGGHLAQVDYTPPSARALQTYEYGGQMAMGGDLQVARGKAEPMSYNPYLPEGGETVMFRGPSHADGGMDIQYGQNGVEVEGGEPAVKLADGGSPDGNLVVFGNMKINDYAAQEIEDPKAKGKKYKNYVADLSKVEAKQNKILNKSSDLIELANTNNPFDQLSMNAGRANLMGANMKLKDIATKKQNAAAVQNAILDTAQERGIESDALAQGKIKPMKQSDMAKFGAKMETAQQGIKAPLFGRMLGVKDRPAYYNEILQNQLMNAGMSSQAPEVTPFTKANMLAQGFKDANQKSASINTSKANSKAKGQAKGQDQNQTYVPPTGINLTDNRQGNYEWTNPQPLSNGTSTAAASTAATMTPSYDPSGGDLSNSPIEKQFSKDKNNSKWGDAALMLGSGLADYFRPIRQFPLDPSETIAEQYALGNNQVDPVYAQTYQPMLDQPYDISLQDQINAIDAQANAAIRAAGQNPAAQAQIMAQSLQAKQQVYGNQFRANQENKNRVYQGNRAAINDSAFKNMGILDTQQVRQSQAKSATKAQTIAALNSISDKVTRNKQENLIAAIDQNRNNFRIDSQGRAINFNTPAQFNMSGSPFGKSANQQGITTDALGNTLYPIYNKDGSIKGYTAGGAKNGAKVKARNGSIVKALKSL